ncbi:MAG TPA: EamA family transporter RarD [Polyangiales bacterium]
MNQTRVREGLIATITAFFVWGLLPLYLRRLGAVQPLDIMAHRVLWSCLLIYGFLYARKRPLAPFAALRDPRTRRGLLASALLVSVNWLVFMYAVAAQRTVDASLGYFINPLFNVVLAVLVLKERLRPLQWTAVGLATLGVLWLAVGAGEIPWIALILAGSFAAYGLIRKLVAVDAVTGLAAETTLIAPFAAVYLGLHHTPVEASTLGWLVFGGLVTAVPLALFAHGARLIPFSTLGLLQYIAPTMQFACGVLVFGEPFTERRAVGFAIIWGALALYAGEDALRRALSRPRADRVPETTPP